MGCAGSIDPKSKTRDLKIYEDQAPVNIKRNSKINEAKPSVNKINDAKMS